jgi:hypothetical protein
MLASYSFLACHIFNHEDGSSTFKTVAKSRWTIQKDIPENSILE